MSLYRSIKSNRPIAISKTEPTIPPIIACLLWLTFIPKSNNHPANKKPQPIKRCIDIFSLKKFYELFDSAIGLLKIIKCLITIRIVIMTAILKDNSPCSFVANISAFCKITDNMIGMGA